MSKKIKVTIEHILDTDSVIDEKTLKSDYDGDWLKLMKEMYEFEGMGIFDNKGKITKVEIIPNSHE